MEANILFGPGSGGVEAWRRVPAAQFNLVVSPWVGLKTAEHLKDKFGTPFLHYPALPVGATESSRFLRTVDEYAGIEKDTVERFINKVLACRLPNGWSLIVVMLDITVGCV